MARASPPPGMLHADCRQKVIGIFIPKRQRVIARLESVFPLPCLSHDEAFCEQLREAFSYTTGILGQPGSKILHSGLIFYIVFKIDLCQKCIDLVGGFGTLVASTTFP